MADQWNIKANEAVNSVTDKIDDWKDGVNKKISSVGGNLQNKVSSWTNKNISSKIPDKFGGDFEKIQKTLDIDLNNINLRDKLKVECPEFMKQCGLSQIDFGTVFLNPNQEAFIAQAQNITNDVINSVNGLQQYLTPEALQSAVDVVQFIITDLIREITGFCLKVFNEYVSVDFVAGLAKDTITSSLYYTKEYTNDPAELLEQLIKDNTEALESDAEDEKVKKRTELMNKINEKFTNTQVWIQERMDEIQPYTQEIAKYMTYGPDYAVAELEALYKKYLMMGVSYVNTQLGSLNSIINNWVDDNGKAIGKFNAEKINNLQQRVLDKTRKMTDTKLQKVKIKALSLINKVTMNLLAMLGG